MSRATRRVLLLIASHVGAVVVGIMAGVWLAPDNREALKMVDRMLLTHRYSEYARLQQALGGPKEYRDALLSLIAAFDQEYTDRKDRPTGGFIYSHDQALTFHDKALTYLRLSRLEQTLGDRQAAEDFLKAAGAAGSQMAPEVDVNSLVSLLSQDLDRREQLERNSSGRPPPCGSGRN